MISAPIGLIAFSLSHGTLSWSETQHLRNAGLDEWIQHLTNIRGRWLAAHIAGVALFPLLGMTIWWMLPLRGILSSVSRAALIVYMPVYVAVDAVLGIGSSILVDYREGLAPSARAGVDHAFEALFFAPSAIDWLDQAASISFKNRRTGCRPRALARLRLACLRAAGLGGIRAGPESLPTLRRDRRARARHRRMAVPRPRGAG